jgi:hypothetical protein
MIIDDNSGATDSESFTITRNDLLDANSWASTALDKHSTGITNFYWTVDDEYGSSYYWWVNGDGRGTWSGGTQVSWQGTALNGVYTYTAKFSDGFNDIQDSTTFWKHASSETNHGTSSTLTNTWWSLGTLHYSDGGSWYNTLSTDNNVYARQTGGWVQRFGMQFGPYNIPSITASGWQYSSSEALESITLYVKAKATKSGISEFSNLRYKVYYNGGFGESGEYTIQQTISSNVEYPISGSLTMHDDIRKSVAEVPGRYIKYVEIVMSTGAGMFFPQYALYVDTIGIRYNYKASGSK